MIAIVNEGRLVGCELEMFGLVSEQVLRDVLIGNGIQATIVNNYTGNASGENHVAIKHDASIHADRDYAYHSYELTWRMYPTPTSKLWLDKLCGVLNKLGMTVNSSCGFHCHIDGSDSTVESMQSLYNLCFKYENIIGGFIPPASRGRNYAKLRGESDRLLISRCRSIDDIMNRCSDRTFGLNLSAYAKCNRKTIEFRYHSPTVDSTKVWCWALLCQRLYEHSKVRNCNSKGKLPNTPANLRNFFCAIGLKPNNRIYTRIDERLLAVRDYFLPRWWKFERATRAEVEHRRAEGRARRQARQAQAEERTCQNCAYSENNGHGCRNTHCENMNRWTVRATAESVGA